VRLQHRAGRAIDFVRAGVHANVPGRHCWGRPGSSSARAEACPPADASRRSCPRCFRVSNRPACRRASVPRVRRHTARCTARDRQGCPTGRRIARRYARRSNHRSLARWTCQTFPNGLILTAPFEQQLVSLDTFQGQKVSVPRSISTEFYPEGQEEGLPESRSRQACRSIPD